MAKKELVESIVKLYSKLGGNMSDVLGSRSNVTFLGTGRNPEPFVDMSINMEAVGALGKSKVLDELKSPMGYLTADKLNDVQAGKLYENMLKLDEFYNPKAAPANITDLATGTRNLDQEGLGALRAKGDYMTDEGVMASETILPMRRGTQLADDLPPPGSRGGPDDIAAPIQSAEETIKQLRIQDPDLADQVKKMMDKGIMSTVTNRGDIPAKRSSAREFLLEALKKDEYDVGTAAFGKTNLNNIISAQDVKFITEGGGGIGGDPIVLVEKYFGPKIAEMIPSGATGDEIVKFTNRVLENVTDASGLRPDNPRFDRMTAKFIDELADGGRAGFRFGKSAGKAFGLAKKIANINKSVDEGTQMGYGALREYGLEAKDISRLFRELAMDRTMVGPEKTAYFKMLNQVLKNPDNFPDEIIEIKKRLGMDFARGGRAGFMAGGIGKFSKAQVLIERLKNTIKDSKNKTDELSVYVNETFPNFIKEIKANPKLAENEQVWKTLGLDLPKDQKLVVYSDDTVDFFRQTEGPQNIAKVEAFMAKHPFLSREDALRIMKMEPEDQVLEITRLQVLNNRTKNAQGGLAKILEV